MVEEVTIRSRTEEHTEAIHETLRHTDVAVEGTSTGASVTGTSQSCAPTFDPPKRGS